MYHRLYQSINGLEPTQTTDPPVPPPSTHHHPRQAHPSNTTGGLGLEIGDPSPSYYSMLLQRQARTAGAAALKRGQHPRHRAAPVAAVIAPLQPLAAVSGCACV